VVVVVILSAYPDGALWIRCPRRDVASVISLFPRRPAWVEPATPR
jgi:hypothetical protein